MNTLVGAHFSHLLHRNYNYQYLRNLHHQLISSPLLNYLKLQHGLLHTLHIKQHAHQLLNLLGQFGGGASSSGTTCGLILSIVNFHRVELSRDLLPFSPPGNPGFVKVYLAKGCFCSCQTICTLLHATQTLTKMDYFCHFFFHSQEQVESYMYVCCISRCDCLHN